jgi:hypothetical protein
MTRFRGLLALIALLVTIAIPQNAWSGSYLDRAALLLEEARRENDTLLPRTMDKEMILVIKSLAEARAKAGRKMVVPPQVTKAHPHLLLVLEASERAADAAADGNFKKFAEYLNTSREEEKTFRTVMGELGYSLPDLSKH